ncbi:MAG: HEAT repeat domain-containing protein [Anaerolineae bacterium]|nr:HEAT repeat domain-containing protein [Anaerolineae bacterium]
MSFQSPFAHHQTSWSNCRVKIGSVIQQLGNIDRAIRDHAKETLIANGANSLPTLAEILRTYKSWDDYESRGQVFTLVEDILVTIGEPAVDLLISLLDDERWGPKHGAIYCLKEIGDKRGIPSLVYALGWDDVNFTTEISEALLQFGKMSVNALKQALLGPNVAVREHAAFCLGRFQDADADLALIQAFSRETSTEVKAAIAYALGRPNIAVALPTLLLGLVDEEKEVRIACVVALGEIGDRQAVSALENTLLDDDPEVREKATEALQQIRN